MPASNFENFHGASLRASVTRVGSAALSKIDENGPYETSNLYGSEFSLLEFISLGLNFNPKQVKNRIFPNLSIALINNRSLGGNCQKAVGIGVSNWGQLGLASLGTWMRM